MLREPGRVQLHQRVEDLRLLRWLDKKIVSGKRSINTGHAGFFFYQDPVRIFSYFTDWFPACLVVWIVLNVSH